MSSLDPLLAVTQDIQRLETLVTVSYPRVPC